MSLLKMKTEIISEVDMRRINKLQSYSRNLIREAKILKGTVCECFVNTWTLDYFLIGTLLEKNHRCESIRQDLATKFLFVLVKYISQYWTIFIISKNDWAIAQCPPPPPPRIRQ